MNPEAIKLHDATLLSMEVDWATGETALKFRTHAEGTLRIVVEDCRSVHVSREMSWGRSVSVLECTTNSDDEGVSVVVQMQSGDVLDVRGADLRVVRGG